MASVGPLYQRPASSLHHTQTEHNSTWQRNKKNRARNTNTRSVSMCMHNSARQGSQQPQRPPRQQHVDEPMHGKANNSCIPVRYRIDATAAEPPSQSQRSRSHPVGQLPLGVPPPTQGADGGVDTAITSPPRPTRLPHRHPHLPQVPLAAQTGPCHVPLAASVQARATPPCHIVT